MAWVAVATFLDKCDDTDWAEWRIFKSKKEAKTKMGDWKKELEVYGCSTKMKDYYIDKLKISKKGGYLLITLHCPNRFCFGSLYLKQKHFDGRKGKKLLKGVVDYFYRLVRSEYAVYGAIIDPKTKEVVATLDASFGKCDTYKELGIKIPKRKEKEICF